LAQGIDAVSVGKVLANIDDRNLWAELLELQLIDRPDVLTVKFRKPGEVRAKTIGGRLGSSRSPHLPNCRKVR
jgi:hypothetical protein